jgi:hypothetical protein
MEMRERESLSIVEWKMGEYFSSQYAHVTSKTYIVFLYLNKLN